MQGRAVVAELINRLPGQTENEAAESFIRMLLNRSISKNQAHSDRLGCLTTLSSGVFIIIHKLTSFEHSTVYQWLRATCGEKNAQLDSYAYPISHLNEEPCAPEPLEDFRCFIPANVFLDTLVDSFFPKPNYQANNTQRLHAQNAQTEVIRDEKTPRKYSL